MLYSHDALGLGHVRRSLAVARAGLAGRNDLAALLVTCSPVADLLAIPDGLDYIKLPSARKVANGRYVPRSLAVDRKLFLALRVSLLENAAGEFDPDLILVDKSPGGLFGELRGALGLLRARRPRTKTVLGVRDILDDPVTVAEESRVAGWMELVRQYYDEVWIYGDPCLFDAAAVYRWPDWLKERTRYLGYLVPSPGQHVRTVTRRRLELGDRRFALVTVGGGEDGERVASVYIDAARTGLLPDDLDSLVVLGPCMPAASRAALLARSRPGLTVTEFVPDLASLFAAADVVVAMGGYNTVCELLGARAPAVLVPRKRPRVEQWLRATALSARGLVDCFDPDELAPAALARAVRCRLERGSPTAALPASQGLHQVRQQLERLLPCALEGPTATNGEQAVATCDVVGAPAGEAE